MPRPVNIKQERERSEMKCKKKTPNKNTSIQKREKNRDFTPAPAKPLRKVAVANRNVHKFFLPLWEASFLLSTDVIRGGRGGVSGGVSGKVW